MQFIANWFVVNIIMIVLVMIIIRLNGYTVDIEITVNHVDDNVDSDDCDERENYT